MKLIVPEYYTQFRCSAAACAHSCCKGWEIDIDEESLRRFKTLGIDRISEEGTPHFVLRKGDICPYLQADGLCELIREYGEGVLCSICRDHPRFRNFWTGFAEMGVGLSCPEAAKLILGTAPDSLMVLCEADEEGYASKEAEKKPQGIPFDAFLQQAELPEDEAWLLALRRDLAEELCRGEEPLVQRLARYLIFRHLADALYDGRLEGRIGYIRHCLDEVKTLWNAAEDTSDAALTEIARRWSEENEYSEEKKDALIESLQQQSDAK